MKEYIGNKCKIHIKRNDTNLFYTATITEITNKHITFIDKNQDTYLFRIEDIIEMRIIKGG